LWNQSWKDQAISLTVTFGFTPELENQKNQIEYKEEVVINLLQAWQVFASNALSSLNVWCGSASRMTVMAETMRQ
jgi:hypothetical protein